VARSVHVGGRFRRLPRISSSARWCCAARRTRPWSTAAATANSRGWHVTWRHRPFWHSPQDRRDRAGAAPNGPWLGRVHAAQARGSDALDFFPPISSRTSLRPGWSSKHQAGLGPLGTTGHLAQPVFFVASGPNLLMTEGARNGISADDREPAFTACVSTHVSICWRQVTAPRQSPPEGGWAPDETLIMNASIGICRA